MNRKTTEKMAFSKNTFFLKMGVEEQKDANKWIEHHFVDHPEIFDEIMNKDDIKNKEVFWLKQGTNGIGLIHKICCNYCNETCDITDVTLW